MSSTSIHQENKVSTSKLFLQDITTTQQEQDDTKLHIVMSSGGSLPFRRALSLEVDDSLPTKVREGFKWIVGRCVWADYTLCRRARSEILKITIQITIEKNGEDGKSDIFNCEMVRHIKDENEELDQSYENTFSHPDNARVEDEVVSFCSRIALTRAQFCYTNIFSLN